MSEQTLGDLFRAEVVPFRKREAPTKPPAEDLPPLAAELNEPLLKSHTKAEAMVRAMVNAALAKADLQLADLARRIEAVAKRDGVGLGPPGPALEALYKRAGIAAAPSRTVTDIKGMR